jgi:hypothetical protein
LGISRAKCSDDEEMILSENEYIDKGYGFGLLANKNSNKIA